MSVATSTLPYFRYLFNTTEAALHPSCTGGGARTDQQSLFLCEAKLADRVISVFTSGGRQTRIDVLQAGVCFRREPFTGLPPVLSHAGRLHLRVPIV